MNDQNAELLELVKALTERVDAMQLEIKQLRLQQADVPEETMVAIAAAVAAYLGHRAKRRQAQIPCPPSGRAAPAAGSTPTSRCTRAKAEEQT